MEILSLPEFVSQCIEKDGNPLPDYMKPPDSMTKKEVEVNMREEKVYGSGVVKTIREEKIKKKSALFKYDRILRLTSEPRLI